ncbi:MAG: TIR domain-containing protein, partial [bacterium]|nr:TIR domain-containing protein [bacterium]
MSDTTKAVFLSYASQDAEAAKRIADSLRSSGVEVWFDADGGLEHGDEWDAKIRKQVKECVLFIAVISAHTQAREEGYFRIEWDLAAERARGIASGVAFILPVVIDDTRESDALVPDRFRSVQWTKLPGGAVPPEVLARFLKLWSHRTGLLRNQASASEAPAAAAPIASAPGKKSSFPLWPVAVTALVVFGGGVWWLTRKTAPPSAPAAVAPVPPAPATPAAPLSEARKLALRAQALIETLESTREDYQLAEELVAQAKAKDTTDAEVCAIEAHIHESYIQRGWDTSDTRRESARTAVQRAIRLDPASFEARFAQARLLGLTGREGEERERQLRELRRERPADQRILRALATVIDRLGRIDESAAIAKESAALPGGDPLALYSLSQGYWFAGRAHDAEVTIEAAIAQKPFTGALLMNVWYKTTLRGDIAQARRLIERVDPAQMQEDRAAFFAFYTELLGHDPDKAIAWLKAVPRDWLNDSWYRGPKSQLMGDAHALAGRPDAARLEWQSALKLTEQRLVDRPKDPPLLRARVQLLAKLGQPEEA